jgi:tetratricopeptide (TPR) repeat protein
VSDSSGEDDKERSNRGPGGSRGRDGRDGRSAPRYNSDRGGEGRPRRDADRPRRDGDGRGYAPRDGERRSYGERPRRDGDGRGYAPRGDGERRPYNSDRPRRDGDGRGYAPRDGERRSYGERPRRDGDGRGYTPRGDGERRPYNSDRPRRDGEGRAYAPRRDGEGRGYGPRRDGERRPYGDRDARPRRDGDFRPRREGGYPPRDGEQRSYNGDRPRRDGEFRPRREGGFPPRDGQRSDRPRRDGDFRPRREGGQGDRRDGGFRPRRDDDQRLWTREGRPARGDRDASRPEWRDDPERQRREELRSVRPRHDDPELPESVTGKDLDYAARLELRTLAKDNAEDVARHLVMAAQLIDEDPELAHRHALSAARRAGRVGIVRETLAITAYATGDFALALRELRTYRRISGKDDQLPLMVDSERGVGRPERALELGRTVDRSTLSNEVQASLAIAMSGARLDLGQPELALGELEIPQLDPDVAYSWSPALFQAYGDVLDELGRRDEAQQWWDRADRAAEALEEAAATAEHETVDVIVEGPEFEEGVELDPIGDAADDADESAEAADDSDNDDDEYTVEDEVAELLGEDGEADGEDEDGDGPVPSKD